MEKLINKPQSSFKILPNVPDYKSFYKSFSWSDTGVDITFPVSDKVALYWEGENGEKKQFTYKELDALANNFAGYLRELGVKKGDRVFFFLPRVPELYYGFLGAVRAGAIAGTLFAAFGTQGAFERLKNSGAKVLVTNSELGERVGDLEKNLPGLEKIIFIKPEGFRNTVVGPSKQGWVSDTQTLGPGGVNNGVGICPKPEGFRNPAIMLYTSGTGRTPVCGMVLPYSALAVQKLTAQWVLDLHPDDIFWCTADPGWITGIAYGIFGNFLNGVSSVVYEGRFAPEKWYQILQDYKVSVWYTAPTALRMLRGAGNLYKKFDFSPLRHIGTVGEPLEPELVLWTRKVFGVPAHDTYWLTETGAMMLANFISEPIKPGSMGQPVPGVVAAILDENGNEVGPKIEGDLAFKPGWPSQMIDVWKNRPRFESYFRPPSPRLRGVRYFVTGDRAYKDEDGYFWFVARADDMIKTAGERVGPFEVESVLMSHPDVVEAAVVGKPDPVRGEIIKAFVVLTPEQKEKSKKQKYREKIKSDLMMYVKKNLAGHAYPREIEFVDELPKTMSGKIIRRMLRK